MLKREVYDGLLSEYFKALNEEEVNDEETKKDVDNLRHSIFDYLFSEANWNDLWKIACTIEPSDDDNHIIHLCRVKETRTFNEDGWGNGMTYEKNILYNYEVENGKYKVYLGNGYLYFDEEEFLTFFKKI